jgi:hypothetical protein
MLFGNCIDNFFITYLKRIVQLKEDLSENMLAKMPQKTAKSPFRNKLTIISLVLLMGLGLSAAYFTVPFIESPIPAPNNLIGNTTNNTVSSPVSHSNISEIKIQTPQENSTPTTNTTTSASTQTDNTSVQNTDSNKQNSNLNHQDNNALTTSNKSKTSKNSKTTQSTRNTTKY